MLVEASPPPSTSRTPRVGSEGEEKRRVRSIGAWDMTNVVRVTVTGAPCTR